MSRTGPIRHEYRGESMGETGKVCHRGWCGRPRLRYSSTKEEEEGDARLKPERVQNSGHHGASEALGGSPMPWYVELEFGEKELKGTEKKTQNEEDGLKGRSKGEVGELHHDHPRKSQ